MHEAPDLETIRGTLRASGFIDEGTDLRAAKLASPNGRIRSSATSSWR